MREIIGAVLTLLGSAFFLLSAIGLLRMPDAFNRMQAGTKATTLGSILFLVGIGVMRPEYLGRTLLLAGFIVLTNPVSSNALARAAHLFRHKLKASLVPDALGDDLAAAQAAARAEAASASLDAASIDAASIDATRLEVGEVPHVH
ncbi:MAG: monovalent cation/H(+) antiporter subunit G [Spirochaetes bacterium]|nr:monovalent cation/H(+) antiporter subunit G [Spirochaetota bacterium]MBU0954563.1 monovalent cation/H(+) antiporter subunit G [Spirochaetota bacterium]